MNTLKYSIRNHRYIIKLLLTTLMCLNIGNLFLSVNGNCCMESIFAFEEDDEIAKNCSEKFGIIWKYNDSSEIDFESYLCFMDCIFTESEIFVNGSVNMEKIRSDIMSLAENNTDLGEIMYDSMAECGRLSNHIMLNLRKNPNARPLFQTKCSPMAQIISDCAAMEYYINCPDKYWIPTKECESMKFYSMERRFTRL